MNRMMMVATLLVTMFGLSLPASPQTSPWSSALDAGARWQRPVWISSVVPNQGAPGTMVTIRGVELDRVGWVRFTGAVAPAFTPISRSELRVIVPAGAQTGPIRLEGVVERRREGFVPSPGTGKFERRTLATSRTPFTVPQGMLHIVNNSQFDLVDLQVNGEQKLGSGAVVGSHGGSLDLTLTAGPVTVHMGAGLLRAYVPVVFARELPVTVVPGQTQNLTFQDVAVRELLALAPSGWVGTDQANSPVRFVFQNDGSFTFFRNGVPESTGRAHHDRWDATTLDVQFEIDGHGWAIMEYPYESFRLDRTHHDWSDMTRQ